MFVEPIGIERLKEALEANEWENNDIAMNPEDFEDFEGGLGSGDEAGFGFEATEMEMEMVGTKQAIHADGDREDGNEEVINRNEEVEQLQAMMLRMQAVRGTCPILLLFYSDIFRFGCRYAGS